MTLEWWQRGAGCSALSPYEPPWRDSCAFTLAQLLDHVQHFVVVRRNIHMVGKEVVPKIVPASTYIPP